MKERLDKLAQQIGAEKLDGIATLEAGTGSSSATGPWRSPRLPSCPRARPGLAGAAPRPRRHEGRAEPRRRRRASAWPTSLKPGGGSEKKSAEVTGSGASRGVDTERNAKGGPIPTLVVVNVTPADVAAFKKEGKLNSRRSTRRTSSSASAALAVTVAAPRPDGQPAGPEQAAAAARRLRRLPRVPGPARRRLGFARLRGSASTGRSRRRAAARARRRSTWSSSWPSTRSARTGSRSSSRTSSRTRSSSGCS